MAKVNQTHRAFLTIKRSNGVPAPGVDPGDVTITIRNPDDDASSVVALVESALGGGLYYFDVPASFTLAHGTGIYGLLIDVDSSSPKVRDVVGGSVPFFSADLDVIQTTAALAVDLALYQGSVWVDSANGNAGTVVGVNGLPSNPVDSLADALTLATAIGYRSIVVVTGSLALLSSLTEFLVEMRGESEIDFNGQSVNGSEFVGGHIKGAMTGVIDVRRSHIEDVIGFRGHAQLCGLLGTITLGAGIAHMDLCHSATPGTQTPTIKFGHATSELGLRGYAGGMQIEDMTAAAHLGSIDFIAGQLVVDSSCTGGALAIRGTVGPVTDNSLGTTVARDGEVSKLSIADFLETSGPNPHGAGAWVDHADLPAALALLGAVLGTPVAHAPTTIVAGGFTWTVGLAGSTVTITRTA